MVRVWDAEWIKTTANGGHITDSDGYDIVFTTAGGSVQLDHEIELYNGTLGRAVFWVRISDLSYSSDTTIRMYYGNSGISTSQEHVDATWSSTYQGVWHLNETGNGTADEFEDSSGNGNHGQGGSGSSAATPTRVGNGQIDGAQNFDGSNDQIDLGSSCILTGNTWTLSFWLRPNSPDTFERIFIQGDDACGSRQIQAKWYSDHVEFQEETTGASGDCDAATGTVTDDGSTWSYITWTYNGSTHLTYVDGVASSGTPQDTGSGVAGDVYIGCREGSQNYWTGGIDELRILDTVRSADWIKTEYYNQRSDQTFYTIGEQVPAEIYQLDSSWHESLTSYTAPTGDDRLLVLIVGWEDSADIRDISSVTFGGVSMTHAVSNSVDSGYASGVEIWYMKESSIPAGSQNFVITWDTTPTSILYGAATFANVHQSDTFEDTDSTTALSSQTISRTVDVSDLGIGIAGVCSGEVGAYTWGDWNEESDQADADFTFSCAIQPQNATGTDTAEADYGASANRQVLCVISLNVVS